MSITKYLCHRTLNDVKFMRDKDSFCLRMHFCPSVTLLLLSQNAPMTTGHCSVREWKRKMKSWEGGCMRGCLFLKEACRSLSRHIKPSTLLLSMRPVTRPPLFPNSLHLFMFPVENILPRSPNPPNHPPTPSSCLSVIPALSVGGRMPLENCSSPQSSSSHLGNVNLFNST